MKRELKHVSHVGTGADSDSVAKGIPMKRELKRYLGISASAKKRVVAKGIPMKRELKRIELRKKLPRVLLLQKESR